VNAFYNEHDGYAAQWLRNLGAAGHIASGVVDERSIRDLAPADVIGFRRAHFFAGIGVWDYALRRAGWPEEQRVWTGSCPCQPFSAAGRRKGFADDRHLWPEWFRLIRECRPPTIFGEQVGSGSDPLRWIDLVQANLESEEYAVGLAILGAHSVRAPHIRQRLYFVAHATDARPARGEVAGEDRGDAHGGARRRVEPERGGEAGGPADADERAGELEHADTERREGLWLHVQPGRPQQSVPQTAGAGSAGELGNANDPGPQGRGEHRNGADQRPSGQAGVAGFWSDAEWIPCADGKARPIEPGTFPLAHGAASRVGRLRAYGNALCAETAVTFIRAAMEVVA
jgi:DNA (cytosine-5)-methyltransferase 1